MSETDRVASEAAFAEAVAEWNNANPNQRMLLDSPAYLDARYFFFAGAAHGVGALRHEVEHETAPN